MFTGIVKESGTVRKFVKNGPSYRLEVGSSGLYKDAGIGDSISVNGVCLTLVEKNKNVMSFDVMEETVKRSTLSGLKAGDGVNLEDSLKAGGAIGGHFVQGHIDCVGRITNIGKGGEAQNIEIEFPSEFKKLIVGKGSVAIDGVSLTVGDVSGDRFTVYIIPHTLKVANLGSRRSGDMVNLEFDIIGKYMARFDELKAGGVTERFLKDKGF